MDKWKGREQKYVKDKITISMESKMSKEGREGYDMTGTKFLCFDTFAFLTFVKHITIFSMGHALLEVLKK